VKSDAIKSITRSGTTFTATRADGTTFTFTQQDSNTNTTYTLTQDSSDGHKITLTPSSGNATTITIPDNNTTYSSKTAASGGTDVSLVTTGEKYTWNNKSNLTLGTTSSTAYRGDYGNAAYAHGVTNKGSAFASGLYKITTNSEGHVTAATAVTKADITGLGIPGSDTNT